MKNSFSLLQGLILAIILVSNAFASSTDFSSLQVSHDASTEQLSLPLIAAAMENNIEMYNNVLSRMLKSLAAPSNHHLANNNTSFSYQAWLLGRILLASKYIHDYTTAEKVVPVMFNLLQNNMTTHDEFYAWAWAYLVTYYADQPKLYDKYKIDMFNAADYYLTQYPKEIENIVWIRVMELQAVASAKDIVQYQVILQAIKQNAKKKTLLSALDVIPMEDYQAWAKAIVMNAAARVDDEVTYDTMKSATEQAIELASKNDDFRVTSSVELAKLVSQNARQYKGLVLIQAEPLS